MFLPPVLLVAVTSMLPAPMQKNVFMPTGYTRPHANIDVIWKMEEYFTEKIGMWIKREILLLNIF